MLPGYRKFKICFIFYINISSIFSCPNHEMASKCCNSFFTTYRHYYWHSCQTFEYLDNCFSYTRCEIAELAYLCSKEYTKVHSRYLPKEGLLAVYENLRRQCSSFCDDYKKLETECLSRLEINDMTKLDENLLLGSEIESIHHHFESDAVATNEDYLCKNLLWNLHKLYSSRYGVCNPSALYCSCRQLEHNLGKKCSFKCDEFRHYVKRNDAAKNSFPRVWLQIILILFANAYNDKFTM